MLHESLAVRRNHIVSDAGSMSSSALRHHQGTQSYELGKQIWLDNVLYPEQSDRPVLKLHSSTFVIPLVQMGKLHLISYPLPKSPIF